MQGVDDLKLGDDLVRLPGRQADTADLALVHTRAYLDQLAEFCRRGGGQLDPDTFARPDSWSAARRAAGAGLAAVEVLAADQADVAFVAARPPGHHALADRAMGFCLLNNVAVAAAKLAAGGERVLIVDWDVHHGNGTQAIFWGDPRVLFVSTHQAPFYPGTGAAEEVGGGEARGLTVNIPLPPGATGDVVLRAFDEVAAPAVERFAPTWVLVSAGYDAHRDDPLADLALSSGDFAQLASVVAGFAPRPGRLVLFLEGGYHLAAIRRSVGATLASLLGAPHQTEPPTSGGPGIDAPGPQSPKRAGGR
ncbi:MAG: histone deacetylase [Actinomycetota bacterium]|nr:histone deacetylase [Actinomycetota bacterium]